MNGKTAIGRVALLLAGFGGLTERAGGGELDARPDALVVRLVHPDRQAAELLRLFDGARWSDPAAALAAWNQRTDNAVPISKPAEAVIALFNREMAAEWRAFDAAELRVNVNASTGGLKWFAIVRRDDGTLAAAITAMRLTYPEDRPLEIDGRERPVARLGRSGVPLGCAVGTAVVVAGSREQLMRGVGLAADARKTPDADDAHGLASPGKPDSGTLFRLDPARISIPRSAPLTQRVAVEALNALGCRSVEGAAFLKDGALSLDVATTLDEQNHRPAAAHPRTVNRAWLETLPADGLTAMVSLAIDPDPAAWDRAFAVADRVERIDPARAGLAPLRTRLNLLAAGAGVKLEADVRPHVRGVTIGVFGDPDDPGRVSGGLIVLHLDGREAAERLVRQSADRIGAGAGARAVSIRTRDRDIRIAWGDAVRARKRDDRPARDHSLAAVCGDWAAEGCGPPARVGAFWPGRLWRPSRTLTVPPPALRVVGDDPPVVWWGWSEPAREHDLFRWTGLRRRIRAFLEVFPPVPVPDATPPRRTALGVRP